MATSVMIWLVVEQGYEHATPHQAYGTKRSAEASAARMQSRHDREPAQNIGGVPYKEPLRFVVQRVPLVQ